MNNCIIISDAKIDIPSALESKFHFLYPDKDNLQSLLSQAKESNLALIQLSPEQYSQVKYKRIITALSLCGVSNLIFHIESLTSAEAHKEFSRSFTQASKKLSFREVHFIPVNCPWYTGETLQDLLSDLHLKPAGNFIDFRFAVESVQDSQISGKVLSGSVKVGEDLVILPTEKNSKLTSIDQNRDRITIGDHATLELSDTLHIGKGDFLARANNIPRSANELDITLCWLSSTTWTAGNQRIIVRHAYTELNAFIENIYYTLDVSTLHRVDSSELKQNDFAKVKLTAAQNLLFDSYKNNRGTGFIELLDPVSKEILALGAIKSESREVGKHGVKSSNIKYEEFNLAREDYEKRNQHKGCVLWFTGLSGSGKSTVAKAVLARLHEMGLHVNCLDGDNVRHGLCSDLGFTADDRSENIRRIGELAKLFMENGNITLCSFISPYQKDRNFVRSILPENRFYETFIDCDIEVCKQRDPKGLYKKALEGQINGFTGIDSPYEAPQSPDIRLKSDTFSVEDLVETVIEQLKIDEII